MVRDRQVRLLRRKMAEGLTQEAAAAAAGMSVRTARTWQQGPLPSESKPDRTWRTREDPFAAVWDAEVVPVLVADEKGILEAKTVLEALRSRHGDLRAPAASDVAAPDARMEGAARARQGGLLRAGARTGAGGG